MTPIKSSLAKTAKQLLGFRNTADLGLRGATQNSREIPVQTFEVRYLVIGGGGAGGRGIGGGGGAGGYRTSYGTSGGGASEETALTVNIESLFPRNTRW